MKKTRTKRNAISPVDESLSASLLKQVKKGYKRTKKAKKETISVEILNYALGEIYKRLNELEARNRTVEDILSDKVEDAVKKARIPDKKIGRWKPEMGEMYYCVEGIDEHCYQWSDYLADNSRWSIGNCYKTEEEAEKAKERMILVQEYKDFCTELNNGVEIDWRNTARMKYYLVFNHRTDSFLTWAVPPLATVKMEGTTYCLDSSLLDKALKKFGEEKLKVILGVD